MRIAVLFAVYTAVPSLIEAFALGSAAVRPPASPGFTTMPLAKPAPGEGSPIAHENFCALGRPLILRNILKTKEIQCAETGCAWRYW